MKLKSAISAVFTLLLISCGGGSGGGDNGNENIASAVYVAGSYSAGQSQPHVASV